MCIPRALEKIVPTPVTSTVAFGKVAVVETVFGGIPVDYITKPDINDDRRAKQKYKL